MAHPELEVMREQVNTFLGDLPELSPIISVSKTEGGWRGLSAEGEVYEVKGNGHIPEEITVVNQGVPIGKRKVQNLIDVDIDKYLHHFNGAVALYKAGRPQAALVHCDTTIAIAHTLRARFNRAMILLASGEWEKGFREYWECEQSKPFIRPIIERALDKGLKPWQGKMDGRPVLIIHAHGFGDTLMCLRYLPRFVNPVMVMPPELTRIAGQFGEVIPDLPDECECFVPILHLPYLLHVNPGMVGRSCHPYIGHFEEDEKRWRDELGPKTKKRVGVAWSIGKPSPGDYPREIDLAEIVNALGEDVEPHSVQTQGAERAVELGVVPHRFIDFADLSAFMWQMDEIVSVDTAALHLAGAIGHPRVTGLLSYWASWRWRARWYRNVRIVQQASSEDWGVLAGLSDASG